MKKMLNNDSRYLFFKISVLALLVLLLNQVLPWVSTSFADVAYDGNWSGTTNQGYGMSFTVSDNRITSWTIKKVVTGSLCTATTSGTLGFTPGKLISENMFSFTANFENDEFIGTFTTPSTSNGTWQSYNEHCQGSSSGTWEARKSVLQIAPDIKANGSDSAITVSSGSPVSITIALDPGDKTGQNADWWVAEYGPDGWSYYDVIGGSWLFLPGLSVAYEGALFNFASFELLNTLGLTVGTHIFYFGVDMNMNGSLDSNQLYFDWVTINVTQ